MKGRNPLPEGYANNYLPYFTQPGGAGLVTTTGFIASAVLLGVFAWLNLLAVRSLLAVNSTVTWWKIAAPAVTIVALIAASSRWDVWAALPAAGIVFSYLGFRGDAVVRGGPAKRPGRRGASFARRAAP